MTMQPQARREPVPQPVTVTLTVKEGSAVHILLTQLIKHAPDIIQDEVRRVRDEIERKLKKAGCELDDEGWRA